MSFRIPATKRFLAAMILMSSALSGTTMAMNNMTHAHRPMPTVELPLVKGWFDGKPVLYLQTEASDADVAKAQGVNYVPRLANAISSQPSSVDDIYVVTNFTQSNIIASAPIPTGPTNQSADYSPLWQVTTVTWKTPSMAHTLMSEQEVMDAQAAGLVSLEQTQIVVNCPVVYSPDGGKLPNIKFKGIKIKVTKKP
ncbi:MAG: hypothetical protein PHE55_12905 [Methylococcaceae bacterium]|nr:hypothetical protein [Methylococcaceae bacterium]